MAWRITVKPRLIFHNYRQNEINNVKKTSIENINPKEVPKLIYVW